MRVPISILAACAALAALAACSGPAAAPSPGPRPPAAPPAAAPGQLLPPSAFAAILPPAARARAIFAEASRVLTHARCVNCHPPDDAPRQGDDHAVHDPPAVRGGAHGRGVPAMRCDGCHQDRNLPYARVPGAPDWHLAPVAMAWLGRTPAQICAQLSDPARNGGKTLAQIQHHLAHDALVGWGWDPGHGRTTPPGTQAELGALFQAWIDAGAVCPADEEKPR